MYVGYIQVERGYSTLEGNLDEVIINLGNADLLFPHWRGRGTRVWNVKLLHHTVRLPHCILRDSNLCQRERGREGERERGREGGKERKKNTMVYKNSDTNLFARIGHIIMIMRFEEY